jgi:hypothetical protein
MFKPIVLLIFVSLINSSLLLLPYTQQAYADPLKNSIRQVIGNYNMEMRTDPKIPVAGQTTTVSLRISSVNGDDLVDLPIVIRISNGGNELERTNPILVPYGHYVYKYTFSDAGIYALDIDINDTGYSGQNIVFTFPINVSSSFAGYPLSSVLPLAAGIVISAVVTGIVVVIFLNRRKKKARKKTVESTKA